MSCVSYLLRASSASGSTSTIIDCTDDDGVVTVTTFSGSTTCAGAHGAAVLYSRGTCYGDAMLTCARAPFVPLSSSNTVLYGLALQESIGIALGVIFFVAIIVIVIVILSLFVCRCCCQGLVRGKNTTPVTPMSAPQPQPPAAPSPFGGLLPPQQPPGYYSNPMMRPVHTPQRYQPSGGHYTPRGAAISPTASVQRGLV